MKAVNFKKKCVSVWVLVILNGACRHQSENNVGADAARATIEMLNAKGDSAIAGGDYPLALMLFQQAMDTAAAQADSFPYYDAQLDIACMYDRLGELDKSIAIGKNVLLAYERSGDSSRVGRAYSTLSAFYGRAKKYPEQLETAQKAFVLTNLHGDLIHRFAAYNQMAFTFSDAGHWDMALPYLDTAYQLMLQSGITDQMAGISLNLGDCYRHLGRYEAAIHYLNQSKTAALQYDQPHIRSRVMQRLSLIAEAQGQPAKALDWLRQFVTLKDSIISTETNNKVRELEVKYASKEKEHTIQLLQTQEQAARREKYQAIALWLITLAGTALGVRYWRARSAAALQALEQSRQHLEEISHLLLVKNTRIGALEQELQKGNTTPTPNDPDDTDAGLPDFSNFSILTEQDWLLFKQSFERSYPGYLYRLREQYPDMSNAEERLFILLKLNYTRQELAAVLGVSDSTVKKGRLRLRKRLGLSSEESLEQVVQGF